MYESVRSILFHLDPEHAHALTLRAMQLVGILPPLQAMMGKIYQAPPRPVEAFGVQFPNPIGLAAGYDKDGLGWRGLACLGFGHIEVGTVTPLPQPGNPRPRLFRLPEDKALINRMGFPGKGAQFVARQLRKPRPAGLKIGVNLGKNLLTPFEDAASDYLSLLKVFAPLADYLVVNVSSPNTVGLRRLQARDTLEGLLKIMDQERKIQEQSLNHKLPLLVKIAPDLKDDELDDALEAIQRTGMNGVIAANTTIEKNGLRSRFQQEGGGLSGAPLEQRSTAMIRQITTLTQGRLPIIGVGGVMNAQDARAKLEAGACLIQVYTGLVYAGPGLVKQILAVLPE